VEVDDGMGVYGDETICASLGISPTVGVRIGFANCVNSTPRILVEFITSGWTLETQPNKTAESMITQKYLLCKFHLTISLNVGSQPPNGVR
jgi:hypothetical protein